MLGGLGSFPYLTCCCRLYPTVGSSGEGQPARKVLKGVKTFCCPEGYDEATWKARVDLAACYQVILLPSLRSGGKETKAQPISADYPARQFMNPLSGNALQLPDPWTLCLQLLDEMGMNEGICNHLTGMGSSLHAGPSWCLPSRS